MASRKKKRPTPPPPPVTRPPRGARAASTSKGGAQAGPSKKAQQRAAAAQQARRDSRRRRLITAGLVVAALAAVGAYVITSQRADAELRQTLTGGTCEVDTESDTISGGDGHVTSPTYSVDPPSGGDHTPAAARGGVYAGAAVPADGPLVHAQEHGYVVAWHDPGLPQEQRALLEQFEARHDGDVIVVERPGMPVPVAATAWGQRLLCGEVEPAVLDRFAEEHVGNGPEDVPRG